MREMPKPVFVVLLVFAAVVVLGATWVGVSYLMVSAPSPTITEDRQVPGFTQVEIHGSGTLVITQGAVPRLEVKAKRGILDRLTTTVSGGTLILDLRGLWYAPLTYSGLDRVTYRLTVTDLTRIEAHGATRIEAEQGLEVRDLHISTSGATEIDLTLNAETVTVSASGAGEVTLAGSADILDFKSSGATELLAGALKAREASIDCSGAADVEVDVSERLDIKISGAGHVSYAGNPDVTSDISGAGDVEQVE